MFKQRYRQFVCVLGVVGLLGACSSSGATDATGASSVTRTVSGSLASASASVNLTNSTFLASDSCSADTVIATDTSGTSTTAAVADDCSFSIDLEVDKSYAISFVLNDVFVASLTFDTGSQGYSSSDFNLTAGETDVALGTITFTGNIALPETNPLEYCDSDDDGSSDFDDLDDDDDSVSDDDERDCDFDGTRDDYDDDSSDCNTTPDGMAAVLEVKPHDDSEEAVDLDKKVKARVDCVVDQATVDATTFAVTSETGDVVECTFSFEAEDNTNTKIECDHAIAFAADTVYTATMAGVLCDDATPVETVSWSWLTSSDDSSDSSDSEDELDDSNSSSDDTGDDNGDDNGSTDDSSDDSNDTQDDNGGSNS